MKDLPIVTTLIDSEGAASLARPHWLRAVPWITPLGRCIQIRLFIPTLDRKSRRIRRRSATTAVERLLLGLAGGGNFTRARGFWRGSAGVVAREPVIVGDAFVRVSLPPVALNNFLLGLHQLAEDWNQEALLVVIDGWPLLIAGSPVSEIERTVHGTPASGARRTGGTG